MGFEKKILEKAKKGTLKQEDVPTVLAALILEIENAFSKLEKITEIYEEMGTLEKRIDDNEKKIIALDKKTDKNDHENLKKHIDKVLEFERTKNIVLLAGVPLHKDVEKGHHEELRQSFEVARDILDALKLKKIYVSAHRFKANKTNKLPLLAITFHNNEEKRLFFAALSRNGRDTKNYYAKNMSAREMAPSYLKDEFMIAQKEGFEARKRGEKVKIRIKRQGIEIMKKSKKDSEFRMYPREEWLQAEEDSNDEY